MVEVKVSGLPHILELWLEESKAIHAVKYFHSIPFLYQVYFPEFIKLSQNRGKSGHSPFLGDIISLTTMVSALHFFRPFIICSMTKVVALRYCITVIKQ